MDTSVEIPREWLADFEAAARDARLQLRFRYAFIHTYKPVLDDAPFRAFDTMEDYRRWCEENLPEWLGYGARFDTAKPKRSAMIAPAWRSVSVHRQIRRHFARLPRYDPRRRLVRRSFGRELPSAVGGVRKLGFTLTDDQIAEIEGAARTLFN